MTMPHEIPINMFDLMVLTVIGLSSLLSFFRGLFKEVFSLAGWAVAAIITLRFLEPVSTILKPHVGSDVVTSGIASVGLFFTTLIIISIISGIILKYLRPGARIGNIDNLGGLAFGIARGVLIVTLGYFITSVVVGEKNYPDWMQHSYTRPYVERSTRWMKEFAPEYLEKLTGNKILTEEINKASDAQEKPAKPQPTTDDTEQEIKDESQPMPSFEDLQKRIKQENENHNVR